MKHLIVILVFSELNIIKTCFESIYDKHFDYFIIENKSINSDAISEYFINKKIHYNNLIGYIQYVENISATAINSFLQNFDSLIKAYDYVTITDGDFYMYDFADAMNENRTAFDDDKCIVSSTDLFLDNDYRNTKRIVGINNYIEKQKERLNILPSHKNGITSNCFLTFKNNSIDFLKNLHYIDTKIHSSVMSMGGKWLVSLKNQSYHLTWDLYIDGNPYYEWKKEVISHIWDRKQTVEYKTIF